MFFLRVKLFVPKPCAPPNWTYTNRAQGLWVNLKGHPSRCNPWKSEVCLRQQEEGSLRSSLRGAFCRGIFCSREAGEFGCLKHQRIPWICFCWWFTHLKINMELKNEGLEDDFPFQTGDFQVPCWFSRVYSQIVANCKSPANYHLGQGFCNFFQASYEHASTEVLHFLWC